MAAMAAGRWMGQADCRGPAHEAAEGQSSGPQHPDFFACPGGNLGKDRGLPQGPCAGGGGGQSSRADTETRSLDSRWCSLP